MELGAAAELAVLATSLRDLPTCPDEDPWNQTQRLWRLSDNYS